MAKYDNGIVEIPYKRGRDKNKRGLTSMDEKAFSLLEKMYIEMQEGFKSVKTELRTEMQDMKTELRTEMQDMKTQLQEEIKSVETNLTQNMVRLEHKMDENHKVLYDGYTQCIEGITEVKTRLDLVEKKVDSQEIRLQVIKGAK
jgi:gas vesicle protein